MVLGLIIGFGSGLFVSGLLISILVYSTTKEISYTKEEPISDQAKVLTNRNYEEEQNVLEEIDKQEPLVEEKFEEELEFEKQLVEITIPSYFNATQIADLLEKEGIVEDSESLLEYIIAKHKTRNLHHGKKTFVLDSSNEEALEILLTRN